MGLESTNEQVAYYMSSNINWNEVIDKKARGIDDYDLGEVQEVQDNVVVTQKGVLDKDNFYLTKRLVDRFDGLYGLI